MNKDNPGFWAGGPDECYRALRALRDEQLEPLQTQLDQATDAEEVDRIESAMARVHDHFREAAQKIAGQVF